MNDHLDYQDKKYISARRVSEKSGYNSDYLGQLCRANKLDCRLVNRTWFVEESSLIKHLKNGRKKVSHLLTEVEIKNKENVFFTEKEKLFFDTLKTKSVEEVIPIKKVFSGKLLINSFLAVFIAVSISIVIFDLNNMSVKNSNFLISKEFTQKIKQYESAYKGEASLSKFFGKIIEIKNIINYKIMSWFNTEKKLTVDDNLTMTSEPISDRKGMVSIPWSESEGEDSEEAVKKYIEESFSDEVLIFPDDSKTSGIIKPVFRKETEEEFFYVMVPVK